MAYHDLPPLVHTAIKKSGKSHCSERGRSFLVPEVAVVDEVENAVQLVHFVLNRRASLQLRRECLRKTTDWE